MNLEGCRRQESEISFRPANNERKYFAIAYELPDQIAKFSLRDANVPTNPVFPATHSLNTFSKNVNDLRNVEFPDTNKAQALTRLSCVRGLTSQEIACINGDTSMRVDNVLNIGKSFE